MRRTKRNNRGDIVIDLTSLLDVIFIVLFIVLCVQSGVTDNLNAREAELEKREHALAQNENFTDTVKNIKQYVRIVSIEVPYHKEEITRRDIMVILDGNDNETFELIGNDVKSPMENFKNCLSEYIDQHSKEPIILSLNENGEEILYRDENAVKNIFSDLSKNHANVYIKEELQGE